MERVGRFVDRGRSIGLIGNGHNNRITRKTFIARNSCAE